MRPVAILLAAGEGKRMGFPKALLDCDGKSFLATLASTFGKAGCDCVAVLGAEAEAVRAYRPRCDLVANEDWRGGMFGSVKVGLAAALERGPAAVLVHPVDAPLIRAATVKAVLAGLADHDGAVPEFEGAPGHPLALSAGAAARVLAMKDVPHLEAAQQRLRVARVKTKDPAVVVDLDTPEAYQRVLGAAPKLAPPPKRRT
jgi:molybdenum cofactor cytidylyltransferase